MISVLNCNQTYNLNQTKKLKNLYGNLESVDWRPVILDINVMTGSVAEAVSRRLVLRSSTIRCLDIIKNGILFMVK